jgi:hypothetical protein
LEVTYNPKYIPYPMEENRKRRGPFEPIGDKVNDRGRVLNSKYIGYLVT